MFLRDSFKETALFSRIASHTADSVTLIILKADGNSPIISIQAMIDFLAQ